MTSSNSTRTLGTLGLGTALCLIFCLILSNAFAAQVTIAWDPNTESDLAGYRVHSGSTSGSYSMHIDVHNVTTYTVTGLTEGQTYYFAATAYDTAGNERGQRFGDQVEKALHQLRETPEHTLLQPVGVGRKKLPSTILGLLFHAAEHTQRHTGQLLVTVRVLHPADHH